MSKSLYQKVGIASLILMASVFLSRVIGLFREMEFRGHLTYFQSEFDYAH